MKLRREQLSSHLQKGIAPLYWITGDEPYLLLETQDTICNRARQLGFVEKKVLYVEPGFDWDALLSATRNLSIFEEKNYIELHLFDQALGTEGANAIRQYANNPPKDTLLVVVSAKLDSRQQQSTWFKMVDKIGIIITIWPIGRAEIFIKNR